MADVKTFEIPKMCKAGVVSNEGPDFKLQVEDVPVPEPGKCEPRYNKNHKLILDQRPERCAYQAEYHRYLLFRHTLHAE
jgi:hypothetical protein